MMDEQDNIINKNVELFAKLYLPEFEKDNSSYQVIFNEQWKQFCHSHLSGIKTAGKKCLIEVEETHWIFLYIRKIENIPEDDKTTVSNIKTENSFSHLTFENADSVSYLAFYIDTCADSLPELFLKYFESENIERIYVNDSCYCEVEDSWIFSLYCAEFFSTDCTEETLHSEFKIHVNDEAKSQEFLENTKQAVKEVSKLRNKIRVCSETLSNTIKEDIPAITDFKHANLFIFFLESLALEDAGLRDESLKDFIRKKVLGEDNSNLIKDLRSGLLLHRKRSSVVFPQSLHKEIFREKSTKDIFQTLVKYLKNVFQSLECNFRDGEIINLKDVLYVCELGNFVEEDELRKLLLKYSNEFVSDTYSAKILSNPHKTMFDFCVNFIPLLECLYPKKKGPFVRLFNVRNQMIHNAFVLYQTCPDLPQIALQNKLPEIREYLLIYIFSVKCLSIVQEFPDDIEDKLKISFEDYKISHLEELRNESKLILTPSLSLESVDTWKERIELYLQTIIVIDEFNRVTLPSVQSKYFDLPTEYSLNFSDEQRKKIFEHMVIIKQMNELLGKVGFEVFTQVTQQYLELTCKLSEKDFISMLNSVTSSDKSANGIAVEKIVHHLSEIKKKHDISETPLREILNNYCQNANCVEKSESNTVSSTIDLSEIIEVNILNDSVCLELHSMIKNIVPVLFVFHTRNSALDSVSDLFENELFQDFLAHEKLNLEKLKENISNTDMLIPLFIKLILAGKLSSLLKEKPDIMTKCIPNLLKTQTRVTLLSELLAYKSLKRHTDFVADCFNVVVNAIQNIDADILKPLFEVQEFEGIIVKRFSELRKNSQTLDDQEIKQLMVLTTMLMNFKYVSARVCYQKKEYTKALQYLEGDKGMSKLLTQLKAEKATFNDEVVIQRKIFVAKVINRVGVETKPKSESTKFFEGALRILDSLLDKGHGKGLKRRLILKIKHCKAYTLHLLEKCQESLDLKREIFQVLVELLPGYKAEEHKLFFKNLINCRQYQNAIRLHPKRLSILNVLNEIGYELICIAKAEKSKPDYQDALEHFKSCYTIQTEILGLHNDLTTSSLLQIVRLAKLQKQANDDLSPYKAVAEICKFKMKGEKFRTPKWIIIRMNLRTIVDELGQEENPRKCIGKSKTKAKK